MSLDQIFCIWRVKNAGKTELHSNDACLKKQEDLLWDHARGCDFGDCFPHVFILKRSTT